jgi:ribosomal 30S subunit maturation factor RimM
MADAWLHIGTVRAVNASRREVRVLTPESERESLADLEWLQLLLRDDTMLRCKVTSLRFHDGTAIIALAPGVTRDNVGRMKGAAVVISPEAHRPSDGYSLSDLTGLNVVDEGGVGLGVVKEAFLTPAHGVLEIERPGGGSMLLPAIDEVMAQVDIGAGTLTVRDVTPFAVIDED